MLFKSKTKSRLDHAEYRVDSAVRVKTESLGPQKFLRFSTRVSLTLINLFPATAESSPSGRRRERASLLPSAGWRLRSRMRTAALHHFQYLSVGEPGEAQN